MRHIIAKITTADYVCAGGGSIAPRDGQIADESRSSYNASSAGVGGFMRCCQCSPPCGCRDSAFAAGITYDANNSAGIPCRAAQLECQLSIAQNRIGAAERKVPLAEQRHATLQKRMDDWDEFDPSLCPPISTSGQHRAQLPGHS